MSIRVNRGKADFQSENSLARAGTRKSPVPHLDRVRRNRNPQVRIVRSSRDPTHRILWFVRDRGIKTI